MSSDYIGSDDADRRRLILKAFADSRKSTTAVVFARGVGVRVLKETGLKERDVIAFTREWLHAGNQFTEKQALPEDMDCEIYGETY
jgi:hypothetical protein